MKNIVVFPFIILAAFTCVLILFFLTPSPALAETRYVSGVIMVNIRDTNKKNYNVLASVETGDKVDVLEEQNHFSRVRTKDNVEGWLPSQYLKKDPPSVETIEKLKKEIVDLKKEKNQLESGEHPDNAKNIVDNAAYEKNIDSLKSQNEQLTANNKELLKKLQEKEASAKGNLGEKDAVALKKKIAALQIQLDTLRENSQNVVKLAKERESLQFKVANLRSDLVQTRELNEKLKKDKMLHWFFAGAAVFFLGFLSSRIFIRKKSKLTF
jgi:SH3 domain protein